MTMSSNIVNLHSGIDLDSDAGRALIVDLARYADGVLTEWQVRKRHRLPDAIWKNMAEDDQLVEAVELEKTRRIRDGSSKREKAQMHVVRAPDVLSVIMDDASASPRHRVDAIKVLDGLAANGPQSAPAGDRFIISINISGDGSSTGPDVLHFDKPIKVGVDADDPQKLIPANKQKDDDSE
jgi:hypothetical protein